jgi:hypothetical protein
MSATAGALVDLGGGPIPQLPPHASPLRRNLLVLLGAAVVRVA